MSVAIPTAADLAAATSGEIWGLRHALVPSDSGNWTAPDLFIHGRDYMMLEPASPNISQGQDAGQFVRTYRLMAENSFDRSFTWVGRLPWVSAERLRLFMASLVGYPYVMTGSDSKQQLFRHLPEPYYAGTDGSAFTWVDKRCGQTGITRYELYASRIMSVHGLGPEGQSPATVRYTWTPTNQSVIWSPEFPGAAPLPDEAYNNYVVTVMFERLPYEVMTKTDAYFAGEWSRFVIYPEEAQGRALQIRAGVEWDPDNGQGQPAAGPNRVTGVFSSKEGAPKLIGQNNLTWKWVDLPYNAYNWGSGIGGTDYSKGGIKGRFGTVNGSDFGDATHLPQYWLPAQCGLLRTAKRDQKPSVIGLPIWDITFFFEDARGDPGADGGLGYWNRLVNPRGVYQRYRPVASGGNFYLISVMTNYWQTKDYW